MADAEWVLASMRSEHSPSLLEEELLLDGDSE